MRYAAANTIEEALAALEPGAEVLAGGTDLVVGARSGRRALPETLIAIDRIAELKQLQTEADGTLTIGALVNHETLYRSRTVREAATAISDGAGVIGSPATRHVGTIGGNLANGSPAMDTGAPLVVLGARVELRSAQRQRTIPVEELFAGPGRTHIARDELLVAVQVPPAGERAGSAYVRLEYRRAMEITVVGVAASVALDPGGDTIESTRLALSSVAPTIIRAHDAEAALVGGQARDASFEAAGRSAAEIARPISDVRAGADYRRAMIAVIVKRALDAATTRARGVYVTVPASHHESNA